MTESFTLSADSARFRLGRVYATPGALAALKAAKLHPIALIVRHVRGDWGELDEEDQKQNEVALIAGMRLLSSYTLTTGKKVWVITEADWSATTLLLPGRILAAQQRRANQRRARRAASFSTISTIMARSWLLTFESSWARWLAWSLARLLATVSKSEVSH